MAETMIFPRHLILAGALLAGVLLALAMHMLSARLGFDLGSLWPSGPGGLEPASAAIAWWLIAAAGFGGGYFTAALMHGAVSGQIPHRLRQFLIVVGVLLLAGAGETASAPGHGPTLAGLLSGLAALSVGGLMAFCGAHLVLRKF